MEPWREAYREVSKNKPYQSWCGKVTKNLDKGPYLNYKIKIEGERYGTNIPLEGKSQLELIVDIYCSVGQLLQKHEKRID